MRAWVHFGLAALLVLAPAFCCCNIRGLAGFATASTATAPACPSCPEPAPVAAPVKKSCCDQAKAVETVPQPVQHPTKPAHPTPPSDCKCLGERPHATTPEPAPAIPAPEPTGELLPFALAHPAAVAPEHLGLLGGLDPPERAGVDALYEALFSRHQLRC